MEPGTHALQGRPTVRHPCSTAHGVVHAVAHPVSHASAAAGADAIDAYGCVDWFDYAVPTPREDLEPRDS